VFSGERDALLESLFREKQGQRDIRLDFLFQKFNGSLFRLIHASPG
jgi:hypothetical protein